MFLLNLNLASCIQRLYEARAAVDVQRIVHEEFVRWFGADLYAGAAQRVFGAKGLVATLNDESMLDIRNKAAHDEVLSRDEAQQTRAWAMQILEQV